MTCLRCGDNLAGLRHPHNCSGSGATDWDWDRDEELA
jgi:hypothetical protein